MEVAKKPRYGLTWMAVAGVCLAAQLARASQPSERPVDTPVPTAALAVTDVALAYGGLLTGQLLDEQMQPIAGANVAIATGGRTIAATVTDADGVFAVAGLRGGFHQISSPDAVQYCRFWLSGTEPPSATQGVRIVANEGIARGQWGPPPMANRFVRQAKCWAANPFVVGGVVAAAVAIPVALHNDDDPAS